jgi:multidrug efflux pump subunit AcrB
MEKPVGVNYIWGGDQENQSEGFGTLGFLLLAIILVYLVMVGLYDSFAHHLWFICHSAFLYWSFISLGDK